MKCKLVDSLSSASKNLVGSDFFLSDSGRLLCKIREVFGRAQVMGVARKYKTLSPCFRWHTKEAKYPKRDVGVSQKIVTYIPKKRNIPEGEVPSSW